MAKALEAVGPPSPWAAFRPGWIVYQDAELIVVDKPEGVPTQRGQGEDLLSRLSAYLTATGQDGYLALPQDLERDVSGLVALSRRKAANAGLARQLEGGEVRWGVVALVQGDARRLRGRQVGLGTGGARARGDARARRFDAADASRELADGPSSLRVAHVEFRDGTSRVQLAVQGARPRDARSWLAACGHPVWGEPDAPGPGGGMPAPRVMWHVARLSLRHPTSGEPCAFERPAPALLQRWWEGAASDGFGPRAWVEPALEMAIERRHALAQDPRTDAFRLVHGAGDGLGGVNVDVFGRWLSVHAHGPPEQVPRALLDALEALGFAGIYLKRQPRQANVIVQPQDPQLAPARPVRGAPAPEVLTVCEHGLPYEVRLADGLRTGLFLDQRENRQRVRSLAQGKRVLNLFAYTCSFSVAALAGGAREVCSIDASQAALAWGQRNVARLGATDRHRVEVGDVFAALQRLGQAGARFDLVIVDPPTYSTVQGRRFRAHKDYPDLLRAVLRVTAPKGTVLAAINRRGTRTAGFRRLLEQGLRQAGRAGRVRLPRPSPELPRTRNDDWGAKSLWIEV